jgi:hypothetical protein
MDIWYFALPGIFGALHMAVFLCCCFGSNGFVEIFYGRGGEYRYPVLMQMVVVFFIAFDFGNFTQRSFI